MKPDKHKKEKNAIYKKKHGITDGNKQEQKNNEQIRDTKTKDKAHQVGAVSNTSRTLTANRCDVNESMKHGRSDKPGIDTYTSSSEKTQLEVKETNYQRRKVVSNWQRYEVEESTTPTLRGSDFATLLNSSASVVSHSQYRDELGLMNTEDRKQNTSAKFLTLDCDDLANSLMCIPLHEQLGVEDSIFEPVMLQHCFELSKESASKYARTCNNAKPSPVDASDYASTDSSNSTEEELITAASHDPLLENVGKESSGHLLNKDDGGHSLLKDPPGIVQESTSSSELGSGCQHNVETSTDITSTETVTQPESEVKNEALLPSPSASSVQEKAVAGTKCSTAHSKQSLKELENELDLLLSL